MVRLYCFTVEAPGTKHSFVGVSVSDNFEYIMKHLRWIGLGWLVPWNTVIDDMGLIALPEFINIFSDVLSSPHAKIFATPPCEFATEEKAAEFTKSLLDDQKVIVRCYKKMQS